MSAAKEQPLLVVVGPTASGKTELAIELAERLDGELVSADIVQVYRYFDVGTGKPSASERARAVHHLVDIVEPDTVLDAASWAKLAEAAIAEIVARGRRPIVCGGTFLWVRALLFGLAAAPPGDPVIRARHAELAESRGRAALHAELALVDAEAAARLAPNDFVRVSRALEVHELTGIPLSRFQAEHGFREARFPARLIGARRTPEELDERIAARARRMFEAGWIDEVKRLMARGFGASRAMGSVGYKQIAEALRADSEASVDELHAAVVRATRVFARRQRTWLRDRAIEWVGSATDVHAG